MSISAKVLIRVSLSRTRQKPGYNSNGSPLALSNSSPVQRDATMPECAAPSGTSFRVILAEAIVLRAIRSIAKDEVTSHKQRER